MHFPDGVVCNPGIVRPLIAYNRAAFITIDPTRCPDPMQREALERYKISDRDVERDFTALFSDDDRAFDRQYHLLTVGPVYSVAQHGSAQELPDPKLPNITVVPNIVTSKAPMVTLRFDIGEFCMPIGQEVTLFGRTMGHWHGELECPDGVQEVYEFQGYGAMILDRPESDEVVLWVARAGDKVPAPQQCHMTLVNLDDTEHPLVTLDFAHPGRNYANKELVRRSGPALMGYYTAQEAVFVLNARYINRALSTWAEPAPAGCDNQACLNGGVRLAGPVGTREVRIPLDTRARLGKRLYDALTSEVDILASFLRLGVRVRRASPEIRVGGVWYHRPLVDCVKPGRRLYRHFVGGQPGASPNDMPRPKRLLHEGEQAWSSPGPRLLEPGSVRDQAASLAIPVLIEGAGDWVEKAIVPAFQRYLDGGRVTVTLADDSRWHAPGAQRPLLPSPTRYPNIARAIEEGKVAFLDKAYPPHLERYRRLVPRVVFIVTPDVTHAALCREHLDRALLVLVEKPFEALSENVRALLEARGLAALGTQIYALEHYRCCAWRLKATSESGQSLLAEATRWLGGALREVRFCMVESRPVEPQRVRALQGGLMLDMFPHCPALLAFFGSPDSLDEFQVLEVGVYSGAPIARETYAHVAFTFEDYSGNGWRVPCQAWMGKGLRTDRKFFEVIGANGQAVLIALGAKTHWWHPHQGEQELEGGIYFVDKQGRLTQRAAVETERYKQLMADLAEGTRLALGCAMPLGAGVQTVDTLERLWSAISAHSPWQAYDVGQLDCFPISGVQERRRVA